MTWRNPLNATLLVLGLVAPCVVGAYPSVPAPFIVDDATPGSTFDTPTAIAFLPDGRYFVAEKRGRVYQVTNGIKSANPVWSREDEVLNEHDRGLLGIAIDPRYYQNHYLYLLYTVDPDSNGSDGSPSDAFGRLARYQVGFTDSSQVLASSRTILLGVSWRQGPLDASPSHSIGSLRFGTDGSLLVSMGDGASYTQIDPGGLDAGDFGAGPNLTDPYEDIGAFRAQSLSSLCGKVLRINPANGAGYSNNPYWNGNPFSIRSRVWAYGVRNPFRMQLRPGTGAADTSAGNPGTIYINDVGWDTYEEMNVVPAGGGLNLGWPCNEGPAPHSGYSSATPAHNGCSSVGTADNPTSHTGPRMTWHHSNAASSIPAGFFGNCAVGGGFYSGTQYPAPYQGRYFFADYGKDWMYVATMNASDQVVSVSPFGTAMDGPVDFASNPVTGDLFYVGITAGRIYRIRYVTGGGGNVAPVAVADATPTAGVAPLQVSFSSAGSFDANGDTLSFAWLFGDGSGSPLPNPTHTYAMPGSYVARLFVDDNKGGVGTDSVVVFAAPASGFPTTPVRDDFNRPNGPIGSPWTNTAGTAINANALTQGGGTSSPQWEGGVFGPNQEAYVTLTAITPTCPEHNLLLKIQGQNWFDGHIEVRYDNTEARIAIGTYTPGTGWQTWGIVQPITLQPGDQFGARALEEGTVQVYRNGIPVGSASLATWPYKANGGRIGLTLTDATTSRLDNFGGGDVTVAPNQPPTATILAPADGMFYAVGDTIHMHATGSDPEDPVGSLTYHWQVNLHHNNHVHPSSYVSDLKDDFIIGDNHDDGTGVFQRILLMVTDTQGAIDTAIVSVYPEIDDQIASLAPAPDPPVTGAPAWFHFWLRNAGRMPSPIVHWQVLVDGVPAAQGDTLVAALDSVMIGRALPLGLTVGRHTLRAVVDSLDHVIETSNANNAATVSFDVVGTPAGVGDVVVGPIALSQARPNPSRGATQFTLTLPREARVQLAVFDLQGREVWSESPRTMNAGTWQLTWPATGGPAHAGVYLARIRVDEAVFTRRVARIH